MFTNLPRFCLFKGQFYEIIDIKSGIFLEKDLKNMYTI